MNAGGGGSEGGVDINYDSCLYCILDYVSYIDLIVCMYVQCTYMPYACIKGKGTICN